MNSEKLIACLKKRISDCLVPLITNDYILLGLPYYANIGDTLIWEGTKCFLQTLPYKCLYSTNDYYFYERSFSKDVVILLQGGGNFGDLYREHSLFRKKIIELYPNNRVIILPQTIYYQDYQLIEEDSKFYEGFPNVTICTRDNYSYSFLKRHFKNECLLVPDMAFFMDMTQYKQAINSGKTLYLKRNDAELVSENRHPAIPLNAEIHDWPTCESSIRKYEYIELLFRPIKGLFGLFGKKYKNSVEDFKRDRFYRASYVQLGIHFLCPYAAIYTTRLHVMILAVLLNRKVFLINNKSGKVVNFYNTWLTELENIKILTSKQE